MPNANPFREVNRIYKLPFAVPIKLVTSWGLGVSLIFQAGSWALDLQQRPPEQRQRVLFPCPELAAGRRAVLPAQNTCSPALPGASWEVEGNKLFRLRELICWRWRGRPVEPREVPSPGSAVTGPCRELPADSPAESSAAMVCGSIPGGSLGSAVVGTGTDEPRATPWSFWQRRADLKPPQPWGQSWPLGTATCSLWQVPPHPLCFSPGTPLAVLSVEDTCVPMCVFFLSLSLCLSVLCCGGAGAWLHAWGTHLPYRGEQWSCAKAVCGGGAGQGAPSFSPSSHCC